jgi:hypothetical protein
MRGRGKLLLGSGKVKGVGFGTGVGVAGSSRRGYKSKHTGGAR